MGSKRTSRRELLKGGGALAGGLTLGAVAPALGQTPASGQAPPHDHPMIAGSKELIAYGERSRFVTSVRIAHPMGGRPSPDALRCFLPIHVYDAATGAPVVVILRPGKTPAGNEVRKLLSRLIGRIHRHWPETHITIRGDGHYGREDAMTWCENNDVDGIFGLAGNVVLDRLAEPAAISG